MLDVEIIIIITLRLTLVAKVLEIMWLILEEDEEKEEWQLEERKEIE